MKSIMENENCIERGLYHAMTYFWKAFTFLCESALLIGIFGIPVWCYLGDEKIWAGIAAFFIWLPTIMSLTVVYYEHLKMKYGSKKPVKEQPLQIESNSRGTNMYWE